MGYPYPWQPPGYEYRWTVAAQRSKQVAKTQLPAQEIWGPTDGPALRLITCGGAFDPKTSHYVSNVIVWADGVTS